MSSLSFFAKLISIFCGFSLLFMLLVVMSPFFVVAHNSTVDVPCNIFLIEKSIFPFVVVSSLSFFYARRSISITYLIAPSAAPSLPQYLINSHQRYVPSILKQDFTMPCNFFLLLLVGQYVFSKNLSSHAKFIAKLMLFLFACAISVR